jgi:UDP-GlcNAc3NAcA epimerase
MKILTIVGARPQFIKASAFSRALKKYNKKNSKKISEKIIHTGQHFDNNMSDVFFKELKIPRPKINLNISNLSHGSMTGRMIENLETIFMKEKPDYVLVYGDTNSTLAGALAATKLHIPVIHIESGLRSFNMQMPEEINRVLVDRVSEVLFCPSEDASKNLKNENIKKNVFIVGDIMFDAALHSRKGLNNMNMKKFGITSENFFLCTIHREENTNKQENLKEILSALNEINKSFQVLFPIHPRTELSIKKFKLTHLLKNLNIIEPIPYKTMLYLLDKSSLLLTDSGGMQKESLYFKTPCLTLREETEWKETIEAGLNVLVGSNKNLIVDNAIKHHKIRIPSNFFPYGKGNTADKIVKIISKLK